ncbi:ATP-dependent DNA helicase [Cyclospora cayetanensis]|uniref:ATP-dependent DNA helicase n=1 Tax=Cyclospora cayetanensis TaxID=88456 RepID=A0A1D3D878_9EIME|nr:ATP-dependent DNA helicase [Cyclospora cayetanensis]
MRSGVSPLLDTAPTSFGLLAFALSSHHRLSLSTYSLLFFLLQLGRAFAPPTASSTDGETSLQLFLRSLPFTPTPSQAEALAEIEADMRMPRPMRRLVQGDVGSGKTIVAAGAMVLAALSGRQAALLAPTTALARQHKKVYVTAAAAQKHSIGELLAPLGLKVSLLTGNVPSKEEITRAINAGEQLIVVGTHALLQRYVRFPRLGLLVIDEQHKFGVHQRSKLLRDCMKGPPYGPAAAEKAQPQGEEKGGAEEAKGLCDVLLLTATPIPRTQLMSHCGLLQLSRLQRRTEGASLAPGPGVPGGGATHASAGRPSLAAASAFDAIRITPPLKANAEGSPQELLKEVAEGSTPRVFTKVVDRSDKNALEEVYKELQDCVTAGRQAYWICPFVEETGASLGAGITSSRRWGCMQEGGERSHRTASRAFRELQQKLPHIRFGLLHGRMAQKDQQEVLRLFRSGVISVLVSTTVVEVGIDVPNAAFIVVDSAERQASKPRRLPPQLSCIEGTFGISQLHQLRGRVMRDPTQSALCYLLFDSSGKGLDERAVARLTAAAATTDGFCIASRDASLRGSGTLFGSLQHGRTDVGLFTGIPLEERLKLQREAAQDARELLQIYLRDEGSSRGPESSPGPLPLLQALPGAASVQASLEGLKEGSSWNFSKGCGKSVCPQDAALHSTTTEKEAVLGVPKAPAPPEAPACAAGEQQKSRALQESLARETRDLVDAVQVLMPQEKTDWILSI